MWMARQTCALAIIIGILDCTDKSNKGGMKPVILEEA